VLRRASFVLGLFAAAAGTEDLKSLRKHFFQVSLGTTLHQHVPMSARWLDLLLIRSGTVDKAGFQAVEPAFPRGWNLSFLGERHAEYMLTWAFVLLNIAWGRLGPIFSLVADGTEPTAP
jgi:hypothetical protein